MYPSNSTIHRTSTAQPIPFLPHGPFSDNDINPNSNSRMEEDLISSSNYLFHFPSPYNIHYEDDNPVFLQQLHDILHHQQQSPLITNDQNMVAVQEIINMTSMAEDSSNSKKKKKCGSGTGQIPRKRTSKKDRHSKINTAHGPRDRRMRLSLDVAPNFFGLQDMLGFDKASKTVEWLLTKSIIAIKELTKGFPHKKHSSTTSIGGENSASSTSECEVLSGIDESSTVMIPMPSSCTTKEKKIRGVRKAAFHPLAKESREKARARARERTREKKRQQLNGDQSKHNCTEAINHSMNNPRSFEGLANEVEEPSSREQREEIIGDSLFIGNWSPSTNLQLSAQFWNFP